jgi:hypothetical protein
MSPTETPVNWSGLKWNPPTPTLTKWILDALSEGLTTPVVAGTEIDDAVWIVVEENAVEEVSRTVLSDDAGDNAVPPMDSAEHNQTSAIVKAFREIIVPVWQSRIEYCRCNNHQ